MNVPWKFEVEIHNNHRGYLAVITAKEKTSFTLFWEDFKKSKNKELKEKILILKKRLKTDYTSTIIGKVRIGQKTYYLWSSFNINYPFCIKEDYTIKDKSEVLIKIKKAFIKAILPNSSKFIGGYDE